MSEPSGGGRGRGGGPGGSSIAELQKRLQAQGGGRGIVAGLQPPGMGGRGGGGGGGGGSSVSDLRNKLGGAIPMGAMRGGPMMGGPRGGMMGGRGGASRPASSYEEERGSESDDGGMNSRNKGADGGSRARASPSPSRSVSARPLYHPQREKPQGPKGSRIPSQYPVAMPASSFSTAYEQPSPSRITKRKLRSSSETGGSSGAGEKERKQVKTQATVKDLLEERRQAKLQQQMELEKQQQEEREQEKEKQTAMVVEEAKDKEVAEEEEEEEEQQSAPIAATNNEETKEEARSTEEEQPAPAAAANKNENRLTFKIKRPEEQTESSADTIQVVAKCRATRDFEKKEEGDLSIQAGDVLFVIKKHEGWWEGFHPSPAALFATPPVGGPYFVKRPEITGIFPVSYVEELENYSGGSSPKTPPQPSSSPQPTAKTMNTTSTPTAAATSPSPRSASEEEEDAPPPVSEGGGVCPACVLF
ncbi:RRM domain-containing protein [Balamuthia mandrillaris]